MNIHEAIQRMRERGIWLSATVIAAAQAECVVP